jgi:hypothetical protein
MNIFQRSTFEKTPLFQHFNTAGECDLRNARIRKNHFLNLSELRSQFEVHLLKPAAVRETPFVEFCYRPGNCDAGDRRLAKRAIPDFA